jgi:hypothetical protein
MVERRLQCREFTGSSRISRVVIQIYMEDDQVAGTLQRIETEVAYGGIRKGRSAAGVTRGIDTPRWVQCRRIAGRCDLGSGPGRRLMERRKPLRSGIFRLMVVGFFVFHAFCGFGDRLQPL